MRPFFKYQIKLNQMKKENTSPKADTVKITPKKSTPKFVDKQYKLTRETAPLSLILASRHTTRFPLLYFDEDTVLIDL